MRTTAGKETLAGGLSNVSNGGLNRFVVTADTVGNGATRKLNVINGKEDDRWNLEQWYHTRHSLLFLTLDPLLSQRAQAVNSSPVHPACWSTAADVA